MGSVHDKKALTFSKLEDQLLIGEKILGDKGYRGVDFAHIPFYSPKNKEEKQWNSLVETERVIVENWFSVLKNFSCLSRPWRYSLQTHSFFFDSVSTIGVFYFSSPGVLRRTSLSAQPCKPAMLRGMAASSGRDAPQASLPTG